MQKLIFLAVLMFSTCALAKDKLWFSNKTEIGFGKVFISEAITVEEGYLTKNALGAGLKFKISDNVKYKTFYLLENKRKNNWANGHFLGAAIEFKLK